MRPALVIGLLLSATLLSGCAAPSAPALPSPDTPTPSATATAEPAATRPGPRFALDCGTIVGIEGLAALLPPIAPQDITALHAAVTPEVSRFSYIEALGGLTCEWSTGVPHPASNLSRDTPGVSVEILPDALDAWTRFAQTYGTAGDRAARCTPYGDGTSVCNLEQLVGEYWVHAQIGGLASEDLVTEEQLVPEAAAFFDSLIAQVGSLEASSAAWVPSPGALPLPSGCEAIIPASEVGQIVGFSSAAVARGPHGGWSQWADARQTMGGTCAWGTEEEHTFGRIEWMSYGAWAAHELLAVSALPTSPEAVDVPGLGAGDEAFLRCSPDGISCIVDLVLGGHWIELTIRDPAPYDTIAVTTREGVLAVAGSVVARLQA